MRGRFMQEFNRHRVSRTVGAALDVESTHSEVDELPGGVPVCKEIVSGPVLAWRPGAVISGAMEYIGLAGAK